MMALPATVTGCGWGWHCADHSEGEDTMQTWRFHLYDIWGNARDGWDNNQTYPASQSVIVKDDATDKQIIRKVHSKPRGIKVDNNHSDTDTIYLNRSNGSPYGELRLQNGE